MNVNGPMKMFAIETPFGDIVVMQTALTLFVASVLLIILAIIISKKLKKRPGGFQVVVEKLVTMLYNLVGDTMGKHNSAFPIHIPVYFRKFP